jgi:hypothetical protein
VWINDEFGSLYSIEMLSTFLIYTEIELNLI